MKKLIFISLLSILFINAFCQIPSISFSPQNKDIGFIYITDTKFELNNPIAIYSSIEYSQYDSLNSYLLKISIGESIQIYDDEDVYFNTALLFSFYDIENYNYKENTPKSISFEFGLTLKFTVIKKSYLTAMYDPLNSHFKFALGFKF